MPESSRSRKRQLPSTSQSGRKRHQSVQWRPDLEAGASGTGNTDTRTRNPDFSIIPEYATVPLHKYLNTEDLKVIRGLKYKRDKRDEKDPDDHVQAQRDFLAEWTQFVVDKYKDRRAMTEKGVVMELVPKDAPIRRREVVEHVSSGEGSVLTSDEEEEGEDSEVVEEVKAPRVTRPLKGKRTSSVARFRPPPCDHFPSRPSPAVRRPTVPTPPAPAKVKPANKVEPASKVETEEMKFSADLLNDNGKDDIVCERLYELIGDIQAFAQLFTAKEIKTKPADFLDALLQKENEQLIRYIGCLSQGGKNGVKAWEDLVTSPDTREALVFGIVGRALKEHVFSDLWFGGNAEQKEELKALEKSGAGGDGFARTMARSKKTQKLNKDADLKPISEAGNIMTQRIEKMLAPFYDGKTERLSGTLYGKLAGIVDKAGSLSRLMRLVPDVVYYWTSTFKDEEFAPQHMECYNLHDMIRNSPYEKKVVGGIERAVPREGASPDQTEAIVKIVCFPGLVAYRKGGGALAQEQLANEENRPDNAPPDVKRARKVLKRNGEAYTGDEGFRSKTIVKNVVYLIWGKQRLLTREAGTSRHIDAVRDGNMERYTKDYDGFVELYDVAQDKWKREAARASPTRSSSLGGILGRS
ncbi:hypothetical protein PRZ48_004758 [Zasmidium cellare]|uniref:Uncharacterized protein n=1 Tax=Zasmidium cellare TaxID=395010 RepID=A0ABR0ESM2_ZASCE|nr:hypothetical protein PRZ48_004758 [Zasmidium cellare]